MTHPLSAAAAEARQPGGPPPRTFASRHKRQCQLRAVDCRVGRGGAVGPRASFAWKRTTAASPPSWVWRRSWVMCRFARSPAVPLMALGLAVALQLPGEWPAPEATTLVARRSAAETVRLVGHPASSVVRAPTRIPSRSAGGHVTATHRPSATISLPILISLRSDPDRRCGSSSGSRVADKSRAPSPRTGRAPSDFERSAAEFADSAGRIATMCPSLCSIWWLAATSSSMSSVA
jgi:hypothetical protein